MSSLPWVSINTHWWIFHPIIVLKATKTPEDASDCRLWIKRGLTEQRKDWLTLQVADNEFRGERHNGLAVVTGMMGRHPSHGSSQGLVSLETSSDNITLRPFSNHVSWLRTLGTIAGSVEEVRNSVFYCLNVACVWPFWWGHLQAETSSCWVVGHRPITLSS